MGRYCPPLDFTSANLTRIKTSPSVEELIAAQPGADYDSKIKSTVVSMIEISAIVRILESTFTEGFFGHANSAHRSSRRNCSLRVLRRL